MKFLLLTLLLMFSSLTIADGGGGVAGSPMNDGSPQDSEENNLPEKHEFVFSSSFTGGGGIGGSPMNGGGIGQNIGQNA